MVFIPLFLERPSGHVNVVEFHPQVPEGEGEPVHLVGRIIDPVQERRIVVDGNPSVAQSFYNGSVLWPYLISVKKLGLDLQPEWIGDG